MKRNLLVIGGLLGALMISSAKISCAQGINNQQEMHERVVKLYSFSAHTLNEEQRKAKADEMNAFWDEIKAHRDSELPWLRAELQNDRAPQFFFVDGSNLLMALSESTEDEALVVRAMSRADLSEVDPGAYFYVIHDLSVRGVDTTAAALHILDDPDFAVSVPQHAMTLDQMACLSYLLLPVKAESWFSAAVDRFNKKKNVKEQKSLLNLFFYAQTDETDGVVRQAAVDKSRDELVRKDAQEYLKDAKKALSMKVEVRGDLATVREARRKRLEAISDEAIDDMQEMTIRIVQLRQELKKQ